MVFRPFYAQKEFLRKIPSLPDFEIRDSDDTQTIILENNIRPSSTFFVSGGYLRTVVVMIMFIVNEELDHGHRNYQREEPVHRHIHHKFY